MQVVERTMKWTSFQLVRGDLSIKIYAARSPSYVSLYEKEKEQRSQREIDRYGERSIHMCGSD